MSTFVLRAHNLAQTDQVIQDGFASRLRISDQSVDFKVEDKRAPRDGDAVMTFWNVYWAAKDCGATEQEAKAQGDQAVVKARCLAVQLPMRSVF